jgi:hypothetical protein
VKCVLNKHCSTSDTRSSAPVRPILSWSTQVAASVQQLQSLFRTPTCQGCVEAANNQNPDIDVPRVHNQTATMRNNVHKTDKVEVVKSATKVPRKRKGRSPGREKLRPGKATSWLPKLVVG